MPVITVGHDRPDGTRVNSMGWYHDASGSGGLFASFEVVAERDVWLLACDTIEAEGARIFVAPLAAEVWIQTAPGAVYLQPTRDDVTAGRFNRVNAPGSVVGPGFRPFPRPVLLEAGWKYAATLPTANALFNHALWFEGT